MGHATATRRDYQPSTIAEGPRRHDDSAVDDDEARHLTKAETVTVAAIEQSVPMLADAHALVGRF
jgi:hypothetical protein